MLISRYPDKKDWGSLIKRPAIDSKLLESRVIPILEAVKSRGDEALREFALTFDNILLNDFEVSASEIAFAKDQLSEELKSSIQVAYQNISKFHHTQVSEINKVETMPGVVCWRKSVGIQKVGIYIPGGTAPLFSTVLMLGIPAKIAGCEEVILCSPSNHPAILYAASLVGVTRIFRIGGAQAVAAMAYGTESVPQVSKIFGPGNQYVTIAKQLVSKEGTAIDMPAGPSEVAVFADESAKPAFVASDLLSQAEHGIDSQVILVSTSDQLLQEVAQELEKQLEVLPRKDIAKVALENSRFILLHDESQAIELLNEYAAEHLIIAKDEPMAFAEKIINAGSIFLGHFTPESCGDYASGTNHTLPTNGYAKAYSGVSVDSFVKKITFQQISEKGLTALGPNVITMAEEEELQAHANAVKVRLY